MLGSGVRRCKRDACYGEGFTQGTRTGENLSLSHRPEMGKLLTGNLYLHLGELLRVTAFLRWGLKNPANKDSTPGHSDARCKSETSASVDSGEGSNCRYTCFWQALCIPASKCRCGTGVCVWKTNWRVICSYSFALGKKQTKPLQIEIQSLTMKFVISGNINP